MVSVSFDKVVSGSLIRRFQGLAGGASASVNPLQGSRATISDGLRLGARTFATAVQALNATISFVNISRNTLTQLDKVVGQMVQLASEASERGIGSSSREGLDVRFRGLVKKFREVVANTKIGGDDYLSKGGLTTILQKIGLDRESSETVSRLFQAFSTPTSDDKLASERTKATRPLDIPKSVFDAPTSKIPYRLTNISNSDAGLSSTDSHDIAPSTNIFRATDGPSGANPGRSAVFVVDQNGTVTTQEAGTLLPGQDVVTLRAVNQYAIDETSKPGYSVIASQGDLIPGGNPDGTSNLFLVDDTGKVVQQITSLGAGDGVTIGGVDLSHDGLTFMVTLIDGTNQSTIRRYTFPEVGADPGDAQTEDILNYNPGIGSGISEVQLSPDGEYLLVRQPTQDAFDLYKYNDGDGSWELHSGDGAGAIVGSGMAAGFVAGAPGRVLYGVRGETRVRVLDYSETSAQEISGLTFSNGLQRLSSLGYNSTDPSSGYFAVADGRNIRLYSLDATGLVATAVDLSASSATTHYDLGAGPNIDRLSLAQRSDGRVDIGILGIISTTGDSQRELYRLSFNTQSVPGRKIGYSGPDTTKILDYNLKSRPDAFRALKDLEELGSQIEKNIKALDKMTTYIGESLSFIRSTGLAFLEISDQITTESDADKVASDLRLAIRRNAKGALAQAENLESIVVAALTFGQS